MAKKKINITENVANATIKPKADDGETSTEKVEEKPVVQPKADDAETSTEKVEEKENVSDISTVVLEKNEAPTVELPSGKEWYKIKDTVISVSLDGNRIGYSGEIHPKEAFVVRNVEELLRGGFIEKTTKR